VYITSSARFRHELVGSQSAGSGILQNEQLFPNHPTILDESVVAIATVNAIKG
jgi:hypothetical protein